MRDYLNDCEKIEKMMGRAYRKLACVSLYSERLRSIFEQMARDEDDHARQLSMAKGIPEELFFAGARLDTEKIDELLRRAQQLLRMADNPPRSESLMLETAKEMEQEFMQVHLQNAVRFQDAGAGELFQDLALEDERHLATLDSYYGERKNPSRHPYH